MGKAIVDYIPVGRENAVTRRQLCELTGMRDRALRNAIEDTAKRRDHHQRAGRARVLPQRGTE